MIGGTVATKDVIEAIIERKSIRSFKKDDVPRATISRIVQAGSHAPSAGNVQPWHFFVVWNDERKAALAEVCGQDFIAEAPVVVVVCALPQMSAEVYGERGRSLYCLQDTAAAVQNMLLAAYGYGLGACWTGAFDTAGLKRVLAAEEGMEPVAVVPIGYAAEEPGIDDRRSFEQVVTNIV